MATTKAGRGHRAVVLLAVLVPILAVLTAGLFGYRWYSAANDESLEQAQERQVVLRQAEQAAINLNTLDYRDAEAGLALWQESATGPLRTELSKNIDRYTKIIGQRKVTTEAEVRGSAVKQLKLGSGAAVVLVGIDVTVIPEKGESTVKRERLRLTMSRTPDGWKVSRVQAIQA